MQPEMTLIEAYAKIATLEWQLLIQGVIAGVINCGLVAIIIWIQKRGTANWLELMELRHQNDPLKNRVKDLKKELIAADEQLLKAEQTIERLQGRPIERSFKTEIIGDAGNRDQVIKDSIGNYGPGGSSSFGI